MKKGKTNKNKAKANPSKMREKDVRNLEMSLKDEADGFYHYENTLDKYIKE